MGGSSLGEVHSTFPSSGPPEVGLRIEMQLLGRGRRIWYEYITVDFTHVSRRSMFTNMVGRSTGHASSRGRDACALLRSVPEHSFSLVVANRISSDVFPPNSHCTRSSRLLYFGTEPCATEPAVPHARFVVRTSLAFAVSPCCLRLRSLSIAERLISYVFLLLVTQYSNLMHVLREAAPSQWKVEIGICSCVCQSKGSCSNAHFV